MYEVSEELRSLGNAVIGKYDKFAAIENAHICYVQSDKHKTSNGRTAYADCEKVSDKMKAITGLDFIITFYADASIENMKDENRELLMYHELSHVGFDEINDRRFIVPHDVQDFRDLVEKYGVDWVRLKL